MTEIVRGGPRMEDREEEAQYLDDNKLIYSGAYCTGVGHKI